MHKPLRLAILGSSALYIVDIPDETGHADQSYGIRRYPFAELELTVLDRYQREGPISHRGLRTRSIQVSDTRVARNPLLDLTETRLAGTTSEHDDATARFGEKLMVKLGWSAPPATEATGP